ncbi:MAG: hypothetical protein ABR529_03620 [Actinomycetota bacterium]
MVLLVIIGLCLAYGALRRAELRWLAARVREPLVRPLEEEPHFDDAVETLESCPAPLRMRYAIAWVWGPIAWAVVGGTCAFSAAYFVVDAILARFRVGWEQPLYGAVFGVLSVIVFAGAAGRLATWRFAASVYREATTGYGDVA